MPTPLGHALGGVAGGLLIGSRSAAPHGGRRRALWLVALFAGLGMLPDVDFLFGTHRQVTHSIGAVLLVAAVTALLVPRQPRLWGATGGAYLTHVALDWLGADTVAPFGLMALWPFDTGFYLSPVALFHPVCRQYWLIECWFSLARAVVVELLVLGPLVLLGLGWSGWRRRRG